MVLKSGVLLSVVICVIISQLCQSESEEIISADLNGIENGTSIEIQPCLSPSKWYRLLIVDFPLPWEQAMETCQYLGYTTLFNSPTTSTRRQQIKYFLEAIDTNVNYSHFTGWYRPHLHVAQWFKNGDSCRNSIIPTDSDYRMGKCSVIRRDESTKLNETFDIANCSEPHAFVCIGWLNKDPVKLIAYEGYNITTAPHTGYLNVGIKSFENCSSFCHGKNICAGFAYDNDTSTCVHVMHVFVNFTIEWTYSPNVAFYVKCQSEIKRIRKLEVISNVTRNHFECDVDEVPPGYRQCDAEGTCSKPPNTTVIGLQPIVEELERNLTVDKTRTSKYLRRLISVPDGRSSSTVLGLLGVSFIAIVCLCIASLDCVPGRQCHIIKSK